MVEIEVRENDVPHVPGVEPESLDLAGSPSPIHAAG